MPALTDSSVSLPLDQGDMDHSPNPPLIPDSDKRALQRLVSDSVPHDELLPLIELVVTNVKAASIVGFLKGNDAQTFIDMIDQVCMVLFHPHAIPSLLIFLCSGTR